MPRSDSTGPRGQSFSIGDNDVTRQSQYNNTRQVQCDWAPKSGAAK